MPAASRFKKLVCQRLAKLRCIAAGTVNPVPTGLTTVLAEDRSVKMQSAIFIAGRAGRDRRMARPVKPPQQRAFRRHFGCGCRTAQSGTGSYHGKTARIITVTCLDGQRPLTGTWRHHCRIKRGIGNLEAKATQSGNCQNDRIKLTGLQRRDPRVQIAAQQPDIQIRPVMQQQGPAARGCSSKSWKAGCCAVTPMRPCIR